MVVGEREGERGSQTQVCWEERRFVTTVVRHFRTDVRDVEAPRPLALVAANHRVGGVVARDVGGESRCSASKVLGVGESEVRVDVSQCHAHRKLGGELARITEVESHFVGAYRRYGGGLIVGEVYFAQREVAERGADGLVITRAQLPVAAQVGQEDVVDEFAQPWCVRQRCAGRTVGKGVFRRIPVLRVHIGVGGNSQVAHRGTACIGSDAQRGHTGGDWIELILNVVGCRGTYGAQHYCHHGYCKL